MVRKILLTMSLALMAFLVGCSESTSSSGVDQKPVGAYEANMTAAKAANAKWTGLCWVNAVEVAGKTVILRLRGNTYTCYFSSIRAAGDTGRLWAIIGTTAMSNREHDDGDKLYIRHVGSSVQRIRLCASHYWSSASAPCDES